MGCTQPKRPLALPTFQRPPARDASWRLPSEELVRELVTALDRSTLKGKRAYRIFVILVGRALRWRELAALRVEHIQIRENRWLVSTSVARANVPAP